MVDVVPSRPVVSLILGVLINGIASYSLIPTFGALGAAIGTLCGVIASNALMVLRIHSDMGINSTAFARL
jgi:O-antigen/teichoic acid export membrane protein